MRAHSVSFRLLAIALGAVLLVIALRFPGDSGAEVVPNPDHGKSADAVTLPNLLVHYSRPPTTAEVALSAALAVATLAGVSMLVSRFAVHRRLLAGAAAATASAALALLFVTVTAQLMPRLQSIFIGIVGSLLIGLAAAWLSSRSWPNTSLERTRDA